MTKLTGLPLEILAKITSMVIESELSYDNYKKVPNVIITHPVLRLSINYFDEDIWEIFCNKITLVPEKYKINTWKETFFRLSENVDFRLALFSLKGNYGKIRNMEEELYERYNKSYIPKFVVDSLFKNDLELNHLDSYNERANLLQILRELVRFRTEKSCYQYFKNLLNDVYTNNNKYGVQKVHIYREIVDHIEKFNLPINIE